MYLSGFAFAARLCAPLLPIRQDLTFLSILNAHVPMLPLMLQTLHHTARALSTIEIHGFENRGVIGRQHIDALGRFSALTYAI
jgi:hypothetical protein